MKLIAKEMQYNYKENNFIELVVMFFLRTQTVLLEVYFFCNFVKHLLLQHFSNFPSHTSVSTPSCRPGLSAYGASYLISMPSHSHLLPLYLTIGYSHIINNVLFYYINLRIPCNEF